MRGVSNNHDKLKHTLISKYLKTFSILFIIFFIARVAPEGTIDPWNLFSPKKAVTMIFALAFIQGFGSAMIQILGSRSGTMLTGFFSGLISSTATTAALSRESMIPTKTDSTTETLTFLCATLAMLIEGATILFFGTNDLHARLFLIFLGPIVATAFMIFFQSRKITTKKLQPNNSNLDFLPIFKLALFILVILAASKYLQTIFGQSGFYFLTFIVSLFEIHGSLIANIQLHDSGVVDAQILGSLLAISIAASCISKLFLIFTLGSPSLRSSTLKYTIVMWLSLLVSWWFSGQFV